MIPQLSGRKYGFAPRNEASCTYAYGGNRRIKGISGLKPDLEKSLKELEVAGSSVL